MREKPCPYRTAKSFFLKKSIWANFIVLISGVLVLYLRIFRKDIEWSRTPQSNNNVLYCACANYDFLIGEGDPLPGREAKAILFFFAGTLFLPSPFASESPPLSRPFSPHHARKGSIGNMLDTEHTELQGDYKLLSFLCVPKKCTSIGSIKLCHFK